MNRVKRGVWIGALVAIGWGGTPGISQAVQCQNNIPPSNPNAVYQDHGNGTVTDTRTGLMWKQCSEGQSWSPGACSGTASTLTWSQALAWADAATFAGYADWRVPNVKELSSLFEDCRIDPAINDVLFPNTSSSAFPAFWSASPYAALPNFAWLGVFNSGVVGYNPRSNVHHVRLVRGGQLTLEPGDEVTATFRFTQPYNLESGPPVVLMAGILSSFPAGWHSTTVFDGATSLGERQDARSSAVLFSQFHDANIESPIEGGQSTPIDFTSIASRSIEGRVRIQIKSGVIAFDPTLTGINNYGKSGALYVHVSSCNTYGCGVIGDADIIVPLIVIHTL